MGSRHHWFAVVVVVVVSQPVSCNCQNEPTISFVDLARLLPLDESTNGALHGRVQLVMGCVGKGENERKQKKRGKMGIGRRPRWD